MGEILTSSQCRGARAMLDWSQRELAATAGISRQTIVDFERGARTPYDSNLAILRASLERAGIAFILEDSGGVGLLLTPRPPEASPMDRAIADLETALEDALGTAGWGPALQDRIDDAVARFVAGGRACHALAAKPRDGLRADLAALESRAAAARAKAEGRARDFWSVVLDLVRTIVP